MTTLNTAFSLAKDIWSVFAGGIKQNNIFPVIIRNPKTGIAVLEQLYKDDKLHRTDGPAWIERDAATGGVYYEAWYTDGKLNRANGPAVIYCTPAPNTAVYEAWYTDGKQVAPPSLATKAAPAFETFAAQ